MASILYVAMNIFLDHYFNSFLQSRATRLLGSGLSSSPRLVQKE